MSKDKSRVLVAECDGEIVGHCLGFIVTNPPMLKIRQYGLFQELSVTAKYRRYGIGEKLVKNMLKWFAEPGLERIEVRASLQNELSTVFWRKMGFKPYAETFYCEI